MIARALVAAMPPDDEAFRAWVEASYGASLRLAQRIVANHADAADVVQESYIRAYVALRNDEIRAGEEARDGWLRSVVTRRSLDLLRARRRLREDGDDGLEEAPAPSDGGVGRVELERAVLALPATQRVAFVLRELEGFTLKETAEQLGCSVGAVEQRVLRAWSRLAKEAAR